MLFGDIFYRCCKVSRWCQVEEPFFLEYKIELKYSALKLKPLKSLEITKSEGRPFRGGNHKKCYTRIVKIYYQVIDFLTSEIITKPFDTSTDDISDSNNHQITNGNNKYNHHDTPMEKTINDKKQEK